MSFEEFSRQYADILAGKLKPDPDYPSWICLDCGNKYGRYPEGHVCTVHMGTCDVCGEQKAVTEPRDFGYPKVKKKKTKDV